MTRRTQREGADAQVEIEETGYRQHMEHPLVEVTVWESIDEATTIVFEEVDPVRDRLEPAGTLLGTVPPVAVSALEDAGYEVPDRP